MSKPKADSVKHIFDELGDQPARRRTKDTTMNETTSDADIFPPDRPRPELRSVPPELADTPANLIVSITDFLAGFVAPDYLLDGILQRQFIYSLTAQTGHGKTALALLIARLIGGSKSNAALGKHAADKGRVVYFAGENPDDLRMRVIGDENLFNDKDARISFIPGTFSIEAMRARIEAEVKQLGGVDLIIVDTSAAYFNGKDELSNTEMGSHARMLRTLTTLPGGPCVLVLCHPVKHVTEPSQLLPRGGGAFLAEIDGNITLWKHDGVLLDLHHTDKLRGPGFEPVNFRLETVNTTRLADKKGRIIPTVRAVWISRFREGSADREGPGRRRHSSKRADQVGAIAWRSSQGLQSAPAGWPALQIQSHTHPEASHGRQARGPQAWRTHAYRRRQESSACEGRR